jgi:hypothetical protein
MKKEFFKQFVELMRSKDPRFGRCCYVDTTPLPNDAEDNPFNALCSHGVEATSVQMRLAIIQDLYTGFPVWFDIIPGNVLDVSTIMDEIDEVKHCLDIDIMDLVLDAGYASSSLLNAFNLDGQGSGEKDFRSLVVRMPNKKGYPFMDLFNGSRKLFDNGKYAFVRERHTYFGIKREVDVFGHKEYAYVYLDRENASRGFKNWMDKHEYEFQGMTDKKKTFRLFEDGFFVLISNKDSSPRGILDDYFGRQWIESLFKTSKRYLKLLPISKWTDRTVRGKVLSDIIDTIAYLSMRSMLNEKTSYTMADALSHPRSLTSYVANGDLCVNYPKKQVKEIYQAVGVDIPVSINLDRFRKDRLLLRVH